MDKKRSILRAAAAVVVALAAGHLVQTLKRGAPVASINTSGQGGAELVAATPAVPASASLGVAVPEVTGITSLAASMAGVAAPDCGGRLTLRAEPDAMISGVLSAPCHPSERVVVRHDGLSYTARIAPDGTLALQLPALSTEAVVSILLPDDAVIEASVAVPDAAASHRFGLQSVAGASFDLRISKDDQIRVSAGPADLAAGPQGVMTLGDASVDDPMVAQVYTYPTDPAAQVDVAVEVRITPETCGTEVTAESIVADQGTVKVTVVSIAIPACDNTGNILVLNNLAPDTKIATDN